MWRGRLCFHGHPTVGATIRETPVEVDPAVATQPVTCADVVGQAGASRSSVLIAIRCDDKRRNTLEGMSPSVLSAGKRLNHQPAHVAPFLSSPLLAIVFGALLLTTDTGAEVILGNASFERPDTLASPYGAGFVIDPSLAEQGGNGWEFSSTQFAGITHELGPYIAGVLPASDGNQVAYMQTGGHEIAQTITGFQIGQAYVVSWAEARRPNNPDPAMGRIRVLMDSGAEQVELMPLHDVPSDTAFVHQSVTFVATQTAHRLRFLHATVGWDVTTLIDDVVVRTPTAPAGNFDFEGGDLSGWYVIDGNAWTGGPIDDGAVLACKGWEGRYVLNSQTAGDSATGVLRSGTFTLNTPMTFLMAGYSFEPGVHTTFNHNYVTLNRACDNAELARAWAPQRDDMVIRVLEAPENVGEDVYLEIVDNGSSTNMAWMAVDFFVQGTPRPRPESGHTSGAAFDHVPRSDTWIATDQLGRTLPLNADVGPPRDRFVGIFYLVWLGEHGTLGPFDITEIQSDQPYSPALYPTLDDYLDHLESYYGPFHQYHHWGEPLLGYYNSRDIHVMRKHMQMLADAGVDTLIVDNTNAFSYANNVRLLMSVCQQILNDGGRAPQITILAHRSLLDNEQLEAAHNAIYELGLFPDTWFYWEGKPLLLVYDSDPNTLVIPQAIQDFFTTRVCFGASIWPWFGDGYKKWLWTDLTPQAYGWDEDPNVPEQMPASFAWFPPANMGRSFAGGMQPEYGGAPTDQGLHFAEQAERVLALDPEIALIAGWNEWVAGRWEIGVDTPYTEHSWLGTTRYTGQSMFVDAYNHEYSRDAEPVKGGHADSHYYQLVDFVRRFKGASVAPAASVPRPVVIDGNFSDWMYVAPEFRDNIGDTPRRNAAPGYFSAGPYTNMSGRNDIVATKVTYDDDNLYLYARTRGPMSGCSDSDWMVLYLDTDQDTDTGWEGFDFVVNRTGVADGESSIEQSQGGFWRWSRRGAAVYAVSSNELEIRISRELVDETQSYVALDFKWADNSQPLGDILRFTTHGDAAPNDRFKYRYVNALPPACALGDADCDADVDLSDFAALAPCFDNHGGPECDVSEADFDNDGDLDAADLQALLSCLSGPDQPPTCDGTVSPD